MLGTVASLAIDPRFQLFVAVSLVIYVGVFVAAELYAPTERMRRIIEVGVTAIFSLVCLFWGAHNGSRSLYLETSMPPQKIAGGGTVQLQDITSVNGWNEGRIAPSGSGFSIAHGDHRVNRSRPDAARIMTALFRQLDIQHPVDQVLQMPQAQWEAFLRDLPDQKRPYLGGIPFAVIEVRANDGTVRRETVFKNDEVQVRDKSGGVESFVCIDRVLDIRERTSNEKEAVMVTHAAGSCR